MSVEPNVQPFRCYWPNCWKKQIGIYSPGCPRVNWCIEHLKVGTRIETKIQRETYQTKANIIFNEIQQQFKGFQPPENIQEEEKEEESMEKDYNYF